MLVWINMTQVNRIVEMRPGRHKKPYMKDENIGFTTKVDKLIGPMKPGGRMGAGTIQAIGHLPPMYQKYGFDDRRQPDGSYLFDVAVWDNRKTFAPFLASGLLEMDVREEA
jgi:hypothetical protein